jgi:hypothetical protein
MSDKDQSIIVASKQDQIRNQNLPVESPAYGLDEVLGQVKLIQQVMRDVMIEGTHYGIIPGCGKKPSLLKPGAEKLTLTFRMAPIYEVTLQDMGNGHREYRIKTTLHHIPTNRVLGQGVGSCSTIETRYRYKNIFKGQEKIKVENENIADTYNTVLKMAKKRSLVDACLTATAASDIFTQDIEDMEIEQAKPTASIYANVPAGYPDSYPPESELKLGKKQTSIRKSSYSGDFIMPMGKTKGMRICEIEDKSLESAAKWCKEKNKFPELVSAIEKFLADQKGGFVPNPEPIDSSSNSEQTSSSKDVPFWADDVQM